MQPLGTDAEGKVRKRRCFQLLTEELSSWIKKTPAEEVLGAVLNPS